MRQPGPSGGRAAKAARRTATSGENVTAGRCACRQEDASAATVAIQAQGVQKNFLDDSHFRISLFTCRKCRQAFLYIMTEMIDWSDGEDPVTRIYFPVSPEQDAAIRALRPKDYSDLEPLALEGPYLLTDWPRIGPHVAEWRTGPLPWFSHD